MTDAPATAAPVTLAPVARTGFVRNATFFSCSADLSGTTAVPIRYIYVLETTLTTDVSGAIAEVESGILDAVSESLVSCGRRALTMRSQRRKLLTTAVGASSSPRDLAIGESMNESVCVCACAC